jgi:hypothetical protein
VEGRALDRRRQSTRADTEDLAIDRVARLMREVVSRTLGEPSRLSRPQPGDAHRRDEHESSGSVSIGSAFEANETIFEPELSVSMLTLATYSPSLFQETSDFPAPGAFALLGQRCASGLAQSFRGYTHNWTTGAYEGLVASANVSAYFSPVEQGNQAIWNYVTAPFPSGATAAQDPSNGDLDALDNELVEWFTAVLSAGAPADEAGLRGEQGEAEELIFDDPADVRIAETWRGGGSMSRRARG